MKHFLVQSNSNPLGITPGESVTLPDDVAMAWVGGGYGRIEGDVDETVYEAAPIPEEVPPPPPESKPTPTFIGGNFKKVVEDPEPKENDD